MARVKTEKTYMAHLYIQKDTEHRISLHYYFITINIVTIDGVAIVLKIYMCIY